MDIRKRISQTDALPIMPHMADRLLQLRNDPNASVDVLVQIVELDPSLAAQIVRYARSPLYTYSGEVETIHDAIVRVLGFDTVFNMALGIALAGELKVPLDGSIGLKALWRHSVYSASLTQLLARGMPAKLRPNPGTAYLIALLQQIGLLLLGQLFRTEFHLLNKVISAHPEKDIGEIEQLLLGMTHAQIGAALLRSWNMPDLLVVGIEQHHNLDYRGPHEVFVKLVQLGNLLLVEQQIGDYREAKSTAPLLKTLGLTDEDVSQAIDQLQQSAPDLDSMVRLLAA